MRGKFYILNSLYYLLVIIMVEYFKNPISKKVIVDTGSRVSYSIVVGTLIDYFMGGLTGWGIVGSRATATGINSLTSGPYGWWQDKCYRALKTVPETRTYK